MNRLTVTGALLSVTALLGAASPAAEAQKRLDGPVDVYAATEGPWARAANWSLGHQPNETTPALIPAGHRVALTRAGAESASLTVAGELDGPQTIRVNGSLEAPGQIALGDQDVTVTGLGTINTGTNTLAYLRVKGIHTLNGPLNISEDLDVEPHASFNANGYDVTVGREMYSFLRSSLIGGTGTWRVGYLFIYAGPWDEGQEAQLEDTTVIVDRPVTPEPVLGTSTGACICGWHYKALTLEGYRPFTYGAGMSANAAGGSADTLTLNRSEGGISLADGTIRAGALRTDGTAAEPAVVRGPATLELEGDETVAGCLQLEDVTVTGGALTQACS